MGYNGSNRKGLPQRNSGFKKSSLKFGSKMFSKSIIGGLGIVGSVLNSLYSVNEPEVKTKYYMCLGRKRQIDYEKTNDTLDLDIITENIDEEYANHLMKNIEMYFKLGKMKNYRYVLDLLISKGFYISKSYKKLLKMYLKIGDYEQSMICWKRYVSELTKDIILKSNNKKLDYKSISNIMIEDMIKDNFLEMDKYLPMDIYNVELVRAIYKYRDIESLAHRKVRVRFDNEFPNVK